jgi:hypothetical protein
MLALRPWAMRRPLRQRRGRLAPHAPAIVGSRLPWRRAWLLWRRPRRTRPLAAPSLATQAHRLELLVSATAQWRQILEFTARLLLGPDRGGGAATGRASSPARRLHRRPAIAGPRRTAPQGDAGRAAGPQHRPPLDSAGKAALVAADARVRWRPASRVIRRPLGNEAASLAGRTSPPQGARHLPTVGLMLRPSRRPPASAAGAIAARAAASGRLFAAKGDLALRKPAVQARARRAEADASSAPLRRSVQLVWRKTDRAAAGDTSAMPQGIRRSVPVERAGAAGLSVSVAAAARTAAAPSARSQAALAVDASAIDRITHDVLGRIERKVRIERERRGH